MQRALKLILVVGVFTIACISTGNNAAAATQAAGGVAVSPSIQNIDLLADQDAASFTVTLNNDGKQKVTITPTAADFTADGINGQIRLQDGLDKAHGLSINLRFSPTVLDIPAGGSRTLSISVTGGRVLSPGGHFAMVRYQVKNTDVSKPDSVALNSELAAFVFLNTAGKSTYGARLAAPEIGLRVFSMPENLNLLFTNTANTQTAVRGTVSVSGPFKRQIANAIINENSSLILPGSARLLQTPLSPISSAIWPGIYKVDIYHRAQPTAPYTHDHYSFVYIGWPAIAVGLILIVLLIAVYKFIRRYVRRKRPLTRHSVVNIQPAPVVRTQNEPIEAAPIEEAPQPAQKHEVPPAAVVVPDPPIGDGKPQKQADVKPAETDRAEVKTIEVNDAPDDVLVVEKPSVKRPAVKAKKARAKSAAAGKKKSSAKQKAKSTQNRRKQ